MHTQSLPEFLLRLPWVPMEFVIDGFSDWCCGTGEAFRVS